MPPHDLDPHAPGLAPILADLGASADDVADVAAERPAAHAFARAPRSPAPDLAKRLSGRLAPDGWLLLALEAGLSDVELAAWRDALWPAAHVMRIYRVAPDGIRRRTLQGTETLPSSASDTAPATLVAAQLRTHVLAPDFTAAKFDANAAGWNGVPGTPGYPHFRWMRRFVAELAGDVRARRVLDFGSGAGWVGVEAALRSPGTELSAFDPSPEMVRQAEENARAAGIAPFTGRTGFGEAPPFPAADEEPYDLVLSSGVISFSPDAERWLDGLAATVAPGGVLVVGDLNPDSRGMRGRRHERPLLPVRELNARTAADVRRGLEKRGFRHEVTCGYQLTSPLPQAMHVNETRLHGALTHPLLWVNRAASALHRAVGLPTSAAFDSWVMRLRRS